jgi:ABC-type multidrug transport system ATPase subunit
MYMNLSLINLTKHYGNIVALDQVSVTFTPGIYGILGANGAGKSTMMKLISDNLKRDSGQILYDGTEILSLGAKFRRQLGYMPQEQGMFDQMTAQVFLSYMAQLKGIRTKDARGQINDLLQVTNLTAAKDKPLRSFSGGMKQRVMLAQALLGDPEVLILDEPTAGLDPEERIRIRNHISALGQNKIVLLATHIVSDIESIADQIVLMKNGSILEVNTPDSLLQSVENSLAEVPTELEYLDNLRKRFGIANVRTVSGQLYARIVGQGALEEPSARRCIPSLDDVYLYYLGKIQFEQT